MDHVFTKPFITSTIWYYKVCGVFVVVVVKGGGHWWSKEAKSVLNFFPKSGPVTLKPSICISMVTCIRKALFGIVTYVVPEAVCVKWGLIY